MGRSKDNLNRTEEHDIVGELKTGRIGGFDEFSAKSGELMEDLLPFHDSLSCTWALALTNLFSVSFEIPKKLELLSVERVRRRAIFRRKIRIYRLLQTEAPAVINTSPSHKFN